MTFAERLKKLGLQQNQFAKILSDLSGNEVSTAQVNQWATERRNPSTGVLAFLGLLELLKKEHPRVFKKLKP